MPDEQFGTQTSVVVLVLFGVISILIGWDMVMDYESGTDTLHLSAFFFEDLLLPHGGPE